MSVPIDTVYVTLLTNIRRSPLTFASEAHVDAVLVHNAIFLRDGISSFSCLKPNEPITSDILEAYMELLKGRDVFLSARFVNRRKCYYYSSFFFELLLGDYKNPNTNSVYQYTANIQGLSRNIDIFHMDKLFFPLIIDGHWVLIVVMVQDRVVRYYNHNSGWSSFSIREHQRLELWLISKLILYLCDKERRRTNQDVLITTWTTSIMTELPQDNLSLFDCGMFVMMCADALTENLPLDSVYSAADMAQYRRKACAALMFGDLGYDNL